MHVPTHILSGWCLGNLLPLGKRERSGPGWGISYWWPWRHGAGYWWINPHPWEFYSWQNITAAYALLGWTLAIAYFRRRTPLEALMPELDRKLVHWPASGTSLHAEAP
ncbi:MAG TPA: hypothetical protein VH475_18760 [Tepidisphaeraceae bacterium]